MKLVSWNVNGLRACLGKGFLDFCDIVDADVICLQETKMRPEQAEFELPGYTRYWNSADKKGYSGTAIFTRRQPLSVTYDFGDDIHRHEGRVITAEFEGFWRDYLDLDRDYAAVRAAFARDPRLAPCVAFAPGIRVLRQPAFEALIAFIVSQNNNVPRIKGILARLCALFGEPLPGGARAFPTPERLAACSEAELAPLRSGWRAGYILDAARQVAAGTVDLQAVAVMPLADARRELTRIRGVGPKVAECVLLYGMGRLECFPMDVWMKRAMARLFPEETGKMPESAPAIFGPYAGIAQQYIFHYCRCHPEEIREKTA